jgi:hypothetical protein
MQNFFVNPKHGYTKSDYTTEPVVQLRQPQAQLNLINNQVYGVNQSPQSKQSKQVMRSTLAHLLRPAHAKSTHAPNSSGDFIVIQRSNVHRAGSQTG